MKTYVRIHKQATRKRNRAKALAAGRARNGKLKQQSQREIETADKLARKELRNSLRSEALNWRASQCVIKCDPKTTRSDQGEHR
jgi:hypothetical protein